MRMPARNAKHVLILSEALDFGRFESGAGEQKFSLVEERGDGYKGFVRSSPAALPLISLQFSRFTDHIGNFGQEIFFLWRRKWHWSIERRNPNNWPV